MPSNVCLRIPPIPCQKIRFGAKPSVKCLAKKRWIWKACPNAERERSEASLFHKGWEISFSKAMIRSIPTADFPPASFGRRSPGLVRGPRETTTMRPLSDAAKSVLRLSPRIEVLPILHGSGDVAQEVRETLIGRPFD